MTWRRSELQHATQKTARALMRALPRLERPKDIQAVSTILIVLGELLRALLRFSIGSLSIAGGVVLLVLAVWMVLAPQNGSSHSTAGKDPMQLALFPLAVPYL